METQQPKLRFPEFKGDWEKKKLGSFADVSKLAGYEFTKHIKYEDKGKIIALRGLNIKNNSLELNDVKYIDNCELHKLNRSKLYINDIMFTYIGTIGEVAIIKENDKFYLAPNVSRIRIFDNKILPQYLLQSFNTLKFKQQEIAKYISSSSQPALTMENVRKFELYIPSTLEQTKIATFLTAIDEKLNQLTQKKSLLEEYKKGIMQKIFSQELRFKDDNGNDFEDWEENKLADFSNLIHGDGDWILSKDLSNDGQYKLIQLGNIGFGEYKEKDLKTISSEKFKELKGTPIKKGDLLINRMVDGNLYACILNKDGDYITSVDVCWIRENTFFNNYFLMSLLLYKENQNKLLNLSSGSGRVRISKNNLFNEFLFLLPSILEQTKIANFLSAIDDKINLVNTQLEQTTQYKKGLLQQMFV